MLHFTETAMRLLSKLAILLFLVPVSVLAQPGVRMSADFLPLEVGNRWTYDLFNEGGQKTGTLEFAVQDHRIVGGRSFYLLTQFPFVENGGLIKLVRYDRQERQYMRMVDNDEGPLFLADGARVEVLQAEDSGLPVKFILHGDLSDLTFQRGMGIIEARIHSGKDVQIAKLTALHTSDRKATEAAAQGAPTLPQPKTPEQRTKGLVDNVAKPSDETVALDVQATAVPGGTKFVLTVINSTEKLVPFSFRTGQTYEFAVVDASTGQEVWRWSRRMYFSQVIRQEALRPSRNWTFEVTWNHRDNDLNVITPGKYTVTGSLAVQPVMESEPVTFEIK
jgi:Intracellular proteinase inhibitor